MDLHLHLYLPHFVTEFWHSFGKVILGLLGPLLDHWCRHYQVCERSISGCFGCSPVGCIQAHQQDNFGVSKHEALLPASLACPANSIFYTFRGPKM